MLHLQGSLTLSEQVLRDPVASRHSLRNYSIHGCDAQLLAGSPSWAGRATLCGSAFCAVSFSVTHSKIAATFTAVFAEDSTYSMPLLHNTRADDLG